MPLVQYILTEAEYQEYLKLNATKAKLREACNLLSLMNTCYTSEIVKNTKTGEKINFPPVVSETCEFLNTKAPSQT
jgi:hypothetical protein